MLQQRSIKRYINSGYIRQNCCGTYYGSLEVRSTVNGLYDFHLLQLNDYVSYTNNLFDMNLLQLVFELAAYEFAVVIIGVPKIEVL